MVFAVCAMVFAVLAQLSGSGGDHGRARAISGSCHRLALGPALCADIESADLPRNQASQSLLAGGRDLCPRRRQLGIPLPSSGFCWRHHRFYVVTEARLTAAKLFLRLALSGTGGIRPRVINVDGHPAYVRAIAELKQSSDFSRRCRCRPSPYLNNVVEQGHRFIKNRITAGLGFRSAEGHGGRSRVTRQCMRSEKGRSAGWRRATW